MNALVEQIKQQFRSGTMTIRLVMINIGVFSGIQIINALERLQVFDFAGGSSDQYFSQFWFALPVSGLSTLFKPWTLLSSLFAHFSLWHLFGNLLFLYFAGNTYEQFFGRKRLLKLYLLGGLAGNLSEILAQFIFPALQDSSFSVVGASGAIMAIFIALAVSQPQLKVQLFGIFPLRIYMIAIFFFLKDLTGVGTEDQVAHFAHLGGALYGLWSVRQLKPKMKVKKGGRPMTDEQYRANKQVRQDRLDAILDKISKRGYDVLTKEEKDFLFQQSKDV